MWLYGKDVIKGDTLCSTYTVRPGDSLEVIGKKFKVPYEFLMEINKLAKPESLQVGQQLKVVNGPFHAIVSRSTFHDGPLPANNLCRSFKVGLGKDRVAKRRQACGVRPGRQNDKTKMDRPQRPAKLMKAMPLIIRSARDGSALTASMATQKAEPDLPFTEPKTRRPSAQKVRRAASGFSTARLL